ncbi:hypothetical protein, partial [Listeria sp. ILCC806]|uniref:hypothetical protein n=1 Tax=Listeria sp. ILCC806 TaxID=1918335 RepID=UPI001C6FC701
LSYELIGETSVSSLFHLRFVQFSKVTLLLSATLISYTSQYVKSILFLFLKNFFNLHTFGWNVYKYTMFQKALQAYLQKFFLLGKIVFLQKIILRLTFKKACSNL